MQQKKIPSIGFGTAELGENAQAAVEAAIREGYRMIDTAPVYGSEEAVGRAIKNSIQKGIVKREELFIQTKLNPSMHTYDKAIESFRRSKEELGLEYIDQYLIHWPVPRGNEDDCYERNRDVWRAFELLYYQGEIRMLGVCNFLERHLIDLLEKCNIRPTVNQLEIHPAFQQRGLVRFCRAQGMVIEAWSPMGRGVINNDYWKERASHYGKNSGQLALRWSIEHHFVPIVRSSSPEHIRENLNIFDFNIAERDMKELDGMNTCDQHQDIWAYKRQMMY